MIVKKTLFFIDKIYGVARVGSSASHKFQFVSNFSFFLGFFYEHLNCCCRNCFNFKIKWDAHVINLSFMEMLMVWRILIMWKI